MKKVLLIALAIFIFTGCEAKTQEIDYISARTQTNPNSDTIEVTVSESDNEETTKFNETTESAATDTIDTEITNPIVDTNETQTPDSEEPVEDKISGTYYCDAGCFIEPAFVRSPEYISCITFYENSYCIFHVYYIGGVCDVNGTYQIDENIINVELDLSGTPIGGADFHDGKEYPYADSRYVFEIIDNDHIVFGVVPDAYHKDGFYAIRDGYPFIRK